MAPQIYDLRSTTSIAAILPIESREMRTASLVPGCEISALRGPKIVELFQIVRLVILGPCMDYFYTLPERNPEVTYDLVRETATARGGAGDA